MSSASDLRRISAEVRATRSGLDTLLDDLTASHDAAVWHSQAADASRLRLHTSHRRLLESGGRHLATAAIQIDQRADLLDASAAGD